MLFFFTQKTAYALRISDWSSDVCSSEDNLDLVNAASLLMRLEMVGVDVGRRWETVAEYGVRRIGFHNRPFNDVHLMMAMVRGGRHAPAKQMIAEMRDHAERGPGKIGRAHG